MNKLSLRIAILYSLATGIILFIPFLGRMHVFDTAESFFTGIVFKLHEHGGYLQVLQDNREYWHFPPVFIWIQSFFASISGLDPFSLRLSGPVAGIITLIVIFRIGRRVQDEKFGFIWMLAYSGTVLPLLYFRSGLPYPWTNLFMMLAVTHFAYYFTFQEHRMRNLLLSAVFLGLAVLTTGPVLVLIIGVTFFSWLAMKRFMITVSFRDIVIYLVTFLIIGGSWFIFHLLVGNPEGIKELFNFQFGNLIHPVHSGKSFFLFPVLLMFAGLFPVSVFALPALKGSIIESYRGKSFSLWMRVFFWVSLVFSVVTDRMANNYSTICFLPLSFLGAQMIYRIFQDKERFREYFRILFLLIILIFSIIYIYISLIGSGILDSGIPGWIRNENYISIIQSGELWNGYELLTLGSFLVLFMLGLFAFNDRRKGVVMIFASTAFLVVTVMCLFSFKYEKLLNQTVEVVSLKAVEMNDVKSNPGNSFEPVYNIESDIQITAN